MVHRLILKTALPVLALLSFTTLASCDRSDTFAEYFAAHRGEYPTAQSNKADTDTPVVFTFNVKQSAEEAFFAIMQSHATKGILVAQAETEEIVLPFIYGLESRKDLAGTHWSTDGKSGHVAPPEQVIMYRCSSQCHPGTAPICMQANGSVGLWQQEGTLMAPPQREEGKAASRYESAALDAYLGECTRKGMHVIPVMFARGVDIRDLVAFHQIIMRHPELQLAIYVPPLEEPEPQTDN